jgi:DNA-binding response OmpR family regulator
MNVLIVEDDEKMARLLQTGLRDQGVVSEWINDGEAAIAKLDSHDYDVVVLDIMLPGNMDGFQVCKEIRRRKLELPIIMVTARESIEDRVHGLDAGADDYLPKPFSLAEFLARVRALVRRGRSLDQPTLQVSDLVLDPARYKVERSGRTIKLSKKEFRLLEYLIRNKGKVVTRTMIIEHVWGYKINYTSKVVDVYINYLRNKIDKGHPRSLLQTIRGVGYTIRD